MQLRKELKGEPIIDLRDADKTAARSTRVLKRRRSSVSDDAQ